VWWMMTRGKKGFWLYIYQHEGAVYDRAAMINDGVEWQSRRHTPQTNLYIINPLYLWRTWPRLPGMMP
jgi:hypothetical protein